MDREPVIHCMRCGGQGRPGTRFCRHCGAPLAPGSAERIAGIAFLLKESQSGPMRDILSDDVRRALTDAYERELLALTAAEPTPQPAPAAPPVQPPPQVPPRAYVPPVVAATQPARRPYAAPVVAPRPPRPPAPPRQPYDWSWLAEQQANLFLFAGAFLVVIAALIYVGYSGEELPDTLKMSMLVVYTLAFIAAGVACLRIPRVEVAGKVFFAVGAILVPLNFVAAYNIFASEDFDAERMWLAGSLVTATFYAAVGAVGLGRPYSFASGLAILSATLAAVVLGDPPDGWTYGPPFTAVALAVLIAAVAAPEPFRSRVCAMWLPQARVVVPLAMASPIAAAIAVHTDAIDVPTRWFLAPTMALGLAFYAIEILAWRQRYAHFGAAIAIAGLASSAVFTAEVAPEYYAYAWIAAGAAMLALVRWGVPRLPERIAQDSLTTDLAVLAHISVLAGVATGIIAVLVASDPDSSFALESRWFLPVMFGGAFATYVLHTTTPHALLGEGDELAAYAALLALAGVGTGIVYAADLHVEYYTFALIGAGAANIALARWAVPSLPEHLGRERVRTGAVWLAHAAVSSGVAFAILAMVQAGDPQGDFALQTRWMLPAAFAATLATYALHIASRRQPFTAPDDLAIYGGLLSLAGIGTGIVYAAELHEEYHAYALIGAAAAGLAIARWVLPLLPDGATAADRRVGAAWLSLTSIMGGAGVAVAAALLASSTESDFALQTEWTLTGVFAAALAAHALYLSMRMPVLGAADAGIPYSVALMLGGAASGVVYATELSPEYYAFAALAVAPAMLAFGRFGLPYLAGEPPTTLPGDALLMAHFAAGLAGFVGVVAVFAAVPEEATYEPTTRWFLPALFGGMAAFYVLALASKFRPAPMAAAAAIGLGLSTLGVTHGVVYALEVSPEYYAFASLVPAIALGVALHLRTARIEEHLSLAWREPVAWAGRTLAVVGVLFAVFAAIEAGSAGTAYVPDSGVFLPLAFLAAATFFALDASSTRRWETSAAFLATLLGAGVTVVYAAGAGVEWYGVAFSAAGLTLGFGGRAWSPRWLDARTRDVAAALAVTAGWLPFEGVYRDVPRIAAATHLAAAVFYAAAAVGDRTTATFNRLLDVRGGVPEVRIAVGWLYAAGLVATLGYVNVLRSFPAAEDAEAGSLAVPLMLASIAFLAMGAVLRFVRPDFRAHIYVVALLVAVASISSVDSAGTLALVLSMAIVAWILVAVFEDTPLLAAPAAVFGFAAIAAFREDAGGPLYVIPMAYTGLAVALYAAGFALRGGLPRWSDALRSAGALYALVAPAAGFGILAQNTEGGLLDGQPFEESSLYQWSTIATAAVGLLAVVESSMARRGWAVVAGSAVLLVALLLQIGSLRPDNVQAYTVVIGVYLVALGLVGLSRLKLIPELTDTAPYVEALGATIVMLPSFEQSFDDGWVYTMVLVVEAATFFSLGVALRRRGLLATSLVALVLVAGRALFDAVNALPNWIVVLLVGMALLGIGMAILVGRDRWGQLEARLLSWWEDMGDTQPAA